MTSDTQPDFVFLPGRGSHYSGGIRSFVLRQQKLRDRKRSPGRSNAAKSPRPAQPTVPFADAQDLLRGQFDPFQTLGPHLALEQGKMLQHYIEGCIPNLGRLLPKSFFPPRDIDWDLMRGDSVSISTAIQFAAMSVAYIESSQPKHDSFTTRCRAETLRLMGQRLEAEGTNPSDGMLHSLIGIIATETHIRRHRQTTQPSQDDDVHLHIRGLRAAMACRHGWDLPRYHLTLQFEFIWQDIVADGEISAGQTTFSSHLQRMVPPDTLLPHANKILQQGQWHRLCALELIGAYLNFHETAIVQRTQYLTQLSASADSLPPHPRDLFQPQTAAYATMASTRRAVLRPIAPLFLLHILLFHHRHSSSEELAYQYWSLRKKFEQCDVELGSGPSYLTYAIGMTPNMKGWENHEWMFLLARMLSAECRLSEPTRAELKASLLSFLSVGADQGLATMEETDDEQQRVDHVLAAVSNELLGTQAEEVAGSRMGPS